MRKRSYALFKLHKLALIILCVLYILCVCILSSCTGVVEDIAWNDAKDSNHAYEPISVSDNIADQHIIDRFNEAYYNLPEWLREDMINNGWTVQLCADLSDCIGSDNDVKLNGYTTYADKLIQINADDFATTKRVMCHEVGHYLDYIIGNRQNDEQPSQNDKFVGIFANEYDNFLINISTSIHGEETPSEFWAECCFYYFALPDKLNTYCPQTYDYLNDFIISYSGVADSENIAYN